MSFFCILYRDHTLNLRLARSFRVGNEIVGIKDLVGNGQEAFVYRWKTLDEIKTFTTHTNYRGTFPKNLKFFIFSQHYS